MDPEEEEEGGFQSESQIKGAALCCDPVRPTEEGESDFLFWTLIGPAWEMGRIISQVLLCRS